MLLPPPEVFGLPDKFTEWRPHQAEAIQGALDTDMRFYTNVAPTGSGKSLTYVTTTILRSGRTIILTSTKALQTQLLNDFSSIGMVDIRGRNAYRCNMEKDGTTCDHAPCIAGVKCRLKEGGCHYYDALNAFRLAKLGVTNYACWMTQQIHGDGLGPLPDTLICDEVHSAPNMLDSFLTVVFDRTSDEIKEILPDTSLDHLTQKDWGLWAAAHVDDVDDHVKYLQRQCHSGASRSTRRRLSRMKVLLDNLNLVANLPKDWIHEVDRFSVRFAPVWPADFSEKYLFQGIKKVILTSASVRPKTMEILGVDADDNELVEFPHTFPVANRPMIHVPTLRLNKHTPKSNLDILVTRTDQIIRNRQDRKGAIHSISYDRRNVILAGSQYADLMITNERKKDGIEKALHQFARSEPPAVLISPSMMTGVDWPYEACRFQIILKVPYPSTQGALMKARIKRDPEFHHYIAAQQLVQGCGRGVRAMDDFCECFILDDNIKWFMKTYAEFTPSWFRDAYVSRNAIPSPPKLSSMAKSA